MTEYNSWIGIKVFNYLGKITMTDIEKINRLDIYLLANKIKKWLILSSIFLSSWNNCLVKILK